MPGQLFTHVERRRLGGFPARVSHEDLVTYYTLTRLDRTQVNQYADEASRQVRRGQPEDQANQASCLNLLTNAVIVWNTVYMGAVIDRLKAKGERIDPEDLAHLPPARYDHINPYGRYQFQVDRWAGKKPLLPI